MTQTLHLLRNEIRRLRWEISICFALTLLVRTTLSGDHPANTALLPLVWAVTAALAVGGDPIHRDTAWWITRPCRRRSLLFSKLLFVLLFIHLPFLLAEVAVLALAGWPPGISAAGFLVHQINLAGFVVVPAMAVAALARPVWLWAPLCIVLAALAVEVLGERPDPPASWAVGLWTLVCSLLAGSVLLITQYSGHRRAAGWAVAASGSLLLAAGWVWLTPVRVARMLPADTYPKVQLKIGGETGSQYVEIPHLPIRLYVPGLLPGSGDFGYWDPSHFRLPGRVVRAFPLLVEVRPGSRSAPPHLFDLSAQLLEHNILPIPADLAAQWEKSNLAVRVTALVTVAETRKEPFSDLSIGRCRPVAADDSSAPSVPILCLTPFANFESDDEGYLCRTSPPWPGGLGLHPLPSTWLLFRPGRPLDELVIEQPRWFFLREARSDKSSVQRGKPPQPWPSL